MSASKGVSKDTTLGKRRRSESWDLSRGFGDEEDGLHLDGVSRIWKEARKSCELMLRWNAMGGPEEETAYIKFLEEREAIAREMLAKVACVRLRLGGEVDKSTLRGAFMHVYAHISVLTMQRSDAVVRCREYERIF